MIVIFRSMPSPSSHLASAISTSLSARLIGLLCLYPATFCELIDASFPDCGLVILQVEHWPASIPVLLLFESFLVYTLLSHPHASFVLHFDADPCDILSARPCLTFDDYEAIIIVPSIATAHSASSPC